MFEVAKRRGKVRATVDSRAVARFLIAAIEGCIGVGVFKVEHDPQNGPPAARGSRPIWRRSGRGMTDLRCTTRLFLFLISVMTSFMTNQPFDGNARLWDCTGACPTAAAVCI